MSTQALPDGCTVLKTSESAVVDPVYEFGCRSCGGTGRHMGRFSHNDPDCAYCRGVGKFQVTEVEYDMYAAFQKFLTETG